MSDSDPETAPTFARTPTTANHPDHRGKAPVCQVIAAIATKKAVPAKAAGGVLFRSRSYAEEVPRLFAWADAHVHEETYEDAEYD